MQVKLRSRKHLPLESWNRCEDNFKMVLKDVSFEDEKWMELTQDRV
jgi:hypothetical protein